MMRLQQRVRKLLEGLHFLLTGHTRNDVPGKAANDEGLLVIQIKTFHHQCDDRCKSVAVVKTERCHAVAAPTQLDRIRERGGACMVSVPQSHCVGVAIGSGFVKCILGFAESFVLGCHNVPGEVLEPRTHTFHGSLRSGLPRSLDLFQFFDTRALQKTLAGFGIHRFGRKTILHLKTDFEKLLHQSGIGFAILLGCSHTSNLRA